MSILSCMNTEKYINSDKERRLNIRAPFNAEVLMQSGDEEWTCNLLDISLKGMLVEPPSNININPNNPCALALFLADDIIINARVRIKRTDDDRWGLQYINIDIESLQHLRRLLELNLKDADLINRELSQLG
ncbi:MAG: PilZ domain-containing protein [Gammaproteobacteria bacterium]|nr:PilZ domain-containing protein [Gammaproteobacteria bacterium]